VKRTLCGQYQEYQVKYRANLAWPVRLNGDKSSNCTFRQPLFINYYWCPVIFFMIIYTHRFLEHLRLLRPYRGLIWYLTLFLQIFARRCRLKNAAEQQNICSQVITYRQ